MHVLTKCLQFVDSLQSATQFHSIPIREKRETCKKLLLWNMFVLLNGGGGRGGGFHSRSKIMLSFRMQPLRQKSGIRKPGFNSASRALIRPEWAEL